MIQVAGDSANQRAYRETLRWWSAALSRGIAVPLAPRRGFQEVGADDCAFFFTDATRESGSGFGGFTVVVEEGRGAALLVYGGTVER